MLLSGKGESSDARRNPELRELLVLRLATQLVTDFLAEQEANHKPSPVVVLIGGNE
jgi:hypothetical protein